MTAVKKPKRAKDDAPLTLSRAYKHYGLRTCSADGTSYNGFVWPLTGMVECPDWSPTKECGNGLHACLNGEGDGGLLDWSADARWQMVGFDDYVDLGGKVKFPHCEVATGTRKQVTDAIKKLTGGACHGGTATAGYYGNATAGDYGNATAGYYGNATAGDYGNATAGDRGTATAGYRGTATAGDGGTATAGGRGTATAGDGGTATAGYRGTATAGYYGNATAGDYGNATAGDYGNATAGCSGTATAGDRGTATAGDRGTATAGDRGTATAGYSGIVCVKWWDGDRYRMAVGYPGENGIKAGTAYRVSNGALVECGK